MKVIVAILTFMFILEASEMANVTYVYPESKTQFTLQGYDYDKSIDLIGKSFIVISLRERGADGRFYAVDKDGTVWLSGVISSGAKKHRTPEGKYKVYWKKRFHMSTKYPDESGINNMDYSMFFHKGYALHLGNVNAMSHGCIHVGDRDVRQLWNWANNGVIVLVTRSSYMDYARPDLIRYIN